MCTVRPICPLHRPLSGESKGTTMSTVRPNFVFHTGHIVVNEATISTCTDRPLCLLHRPLRSDESHYVQIQATLASCGEGGHYEHCRQAILFFTHTN